MEFIRWTILGWEEPLFERGLIIPVGFICVLIGLFSYAISIILGIIITILLISFWGTVGYVFISRKVKAFYAEFEREKARRGSKTP